MTSATANTTELQALLARLRLFCFPGGEEPARHARGVRTTERGEMRMAPGAPWVSFTAEAFVDVTASAFRWEARIRGGRMGSVVVTEGFEHGHGYAIAKLGGILPVKKNSGPDFDRGEIQRYLASLIFCPPMLLNHPSLEWSVAGPHTLRVRDRQGTTDASVELDLGDDGRPLAARAERPRLAGSQAILTPWSATGSELREWYGLRVPALLQACWHLAAGPFTYFRAQITSLSLLP